MDLAMGSWRGLIAPKGIPKERMERIEKAVQNPKYQEFMKINRLTNDFEGTEELKKHYFKDSNTLIAILKSIDQ